MQSSLWYLLTWPFRAGPRAPLASRRPETRQTASALLGMEELDMAHVDRVNRHNDALERSSTFFIPGRVFRGVARNAEAGVTPLPDDETYATRYHRAYIEKKGSQHND